MPPFELVNLEAFLLHRVREELASPSLGCSPGIASVTALGHIVVYPHHPHRLSGCQSIKTEVHGAPAVVVRQPGVESATKIF
jgi:hypothetical protein